MFTNKLLHCFSENKWERFDVIYYEYGSLVVIYNSSERASRAFNMLQEASFDDKTLLVMLLPNILVNLLIIILNIDFELYLNYAQARWTSRYSNCFYHWTVGHWTLESTIRLVANYINL